MNSITVRNVQERVLLAEALQWEGLMRMTAGFRGAYGRFLEVTAHL
ncbi:hypothetical protein A2U01_0094210, partial [Trifolium medium]|nr:hypothetical protein [Trifolium medium]